MKREFTKMHGLGNDFVLIDAVEEPFDPSAEQVRALADRRSGVGCDQLLVVDPSPRSGIDYGYRIYNADGSPVGQCGNGARCLALYLAESGRFDGEALRIATATAELRLWLQSDEQVRVDMGVPVFEPAQVPFDAAERADRYTLTLADQAALEIGVLSLGNPHAVTVVPDAESAAVTAIGEALQRHPAFPERVNLGFLQVTSRSTARLRVYERGAGETMACGSGACAAAVVGQLWGLLDTRSRLQLNGGALDIEWAGDGKPVYMTGPARTVYRGEIEIE